MDQLPSLDGEVEQFLSVLKDHVDWSSLPPGTIRRAIQRAELSGHKVTTFVGDTFAPRLDMDHMVTFGLPAIESFDVPKRLGDGNGIVQVREYEWFPRQFDGFVEGATAPTEFRCIPLMRPSNDDEIIAELGGSHLTTFGQAFSMLVNQVPRQEGPLLTDGGDNIFYVNQGGLTWVMVAYLHPEGQVWIVGIGNRNPRRTLGPGMFSTKPADRNKDSRIICPQIS